MGLWVLFVVGIWFIFIGGVTLAIIHLMWEKVLRLPRNSLLDPTEVHGGHYLVMFIIGFTICELTYGIERLLP